MNGLHSKTVPKLSLTHKEGNKLCFIYLLIYDCTLDWDIWKVFSDAKNTSKIYALKNCLLVESSFIEISETVHWSERC